MTNLEQAAATTQSNPTLSMIMSIVPFFILFIIPFIVLLVFNISIAKRKGKKISQIVLLSLIPGSGIIITFWLISIIDEKIKMDLNKINDFISKQQVQK
jgi:ABC-type Na+ efflux pump permease subunit